jgi:putative heme-binding domain-containing protein
LLASFIKSSDEQQMLRYFRAMDFHQDPSKQKILSELVVQSKGPKVLYALKHMDPSKLKMTPAVKTALNNVLAEQKGKIEFVELVSLYHLDDRAGDLLQLGLAFPDSTVGKESVKVLLDWNKTAMINDVLYSTSKDNTQAMIKALWPHMYSPKAIALMENFMLDSTRDLGQRKFAVKTFGGPWEAEDRLLELAKEKKLPEDLHLAASGVFQDVWRATLRTEAAKYLTIAGKEGKPLPSIAVLVDKKGDVAKGKTVFEKNCSNCHMINKQGTDFGPDLSEIGAKLSKEGLYNAIIYPDQGISFGFEAWRIKLNDGTTAFGRIISETEDKLEVQYVTNKQIVLKQDIASRSELENSLMPSNLTSNISEEELVDLVEYLSTLEKAAL